MKKEQIIEENIRLIEENIRLKRNNEVLDRRDEDARKEFAKAFGWVKGSSPYRLMGEPGKENPTWAEIYVELGKILAARNFMDFEGNLSELEYKLEDLEKKIRSEIHPNL